MFLAWAKVNAIRIASLDLDHGPKDLRSLKAAIGQVRILALGESGHEIHEPLAFRNRLFKFLVNEMGFSAIAVETGFLEGCLVDDYIQGRGADLEAAVPNVFQWSAPKGFEENLNLIQWMRAYNAGATGGRKIRFYGIDLTGGRDGKWPGARSALDAPLAYLDHADAARAGQIRRQLEPLAAKFNDDAYAKLSAEERSRLTATIAEIVSVFQRRRIDFLQTTTELEYSRALQQAVGAVHLDGIFRNSNAPRAEADDLRDVWNVRDAAMADNVRWALEREGPRGRILVFTHNAHARKSPAHREAYPEYFQQGPTASMGQYLHSFHGEQMRVIGFTFGQGVDGFMLEGKLPLAPLDPESLDGTLARVGLPMFVLDLSAAPKGGAVEEWLNGPRRMRVNDRYGELIPAAAFDTVVFVDTVSSSAPVAIKP
jgi:erythromycin esterase